MTLSRHGKKRKGPGAGQRRGDPVAVFALQIALSKSQFRTYYHQAYFAYRTFRRVGLLIFVELRGAETGTDL
jgi:hypothetical protein